MGKIKVKIKLEIGFYDSFFFGGGNGLGRIQSYMQKDIQGLPIHFRLCTERLYGGICGSSVRFFLKV